MSSSGGGGSGNAGSGGGGGEAGSEGEAEEESSSSSNLHLTEEDQPDHLEEFRQQWKQEVSQAKRKDSPDEAAGGTKETKSGGEAACSVEEQALSLFLEGVAEEEEGHLYEAILKYKKATRLMPDVEKKAFAVTCTKARQHHTAHQQQTAETGNRETANRETATTGKEAETVNTQAEDLVQSFAAMTLQRNFVCVPEDGESVKGAHISTLPMEVLIHILKWVVSSDLDVRSLENFSEVCRGFYLASRSSDIWRLVCLRTWGATVLPLSLKKKVQNNNWRDFFLSRPRVRLNGCYISKMTYLREGERAFTDHEFCRAWHVVTYYRLIRFMPGGLVLMNTTSASPAEAVKAMFPGMNQGYFGQYKSVDDRVICVVRKVDPPTTQPVEQSFKRSRRNKNQYIFEVPEQVLHFELQIQGKKFKQLHWVNYAITSKYKSSGREQTTQFDVKNESNFPALHFSVVKSYRSLVASAPLEG